MPTSLGVNFGREFLGGGVLKSEKTRLKNSREKFAEKFAGNFPNIRQTKIKKFTPWDQDFWDSFGISGPEGPETPANNGRSDRNACTSAEPFAISPRSWRAN